MRFTYPTEMTVNDTASAVLEITGNPGGWEIDFYGLGTPPPTSEFGLQKAPGEVLTSETQDIDLYPIMSALLTVSNCTVTGDNRVRKRVTLGDSQSWHWDITALEAGHQKITLQVFRELASNALVEPERVGGATRYMLVNPLPWTTRAVNSFLDNFYVLVGTAGPLALLLTFLAWRTNEGLKKSIKEIKDLIEQQLKPTESGSEERPESEATTGRDN